MNLTQHQATPEQQEEGVIDLPQDAREVLRAALTFESMPDARELTIRAARIVTLLIELFDPEGYALPAVTDVMIGGAPFFMPALERALVGGGFRPLFAFSRRESVEKDGVKTSIFRHLGFVRSGVEYAHEPPENMPGFFTESDPEVSP